MSQRCDVCGKQPTFGHSVSRLSARAQKRRVKSRTKRRFNPNIQSAKVVVNGTPRRLKVCASCLKRGDIESRVSA